MIKSQNNLQTKNISFEAYEFECKFYVMLKQQEARKERKIKKSDALNMIHHTRDLLESMNQ